MTKRKHKAKPLPPRGKLSQKQTRQGAAPSRVQRETPGSVAVGGATRVVLIGIGILGLLHLVASFVPSIRVWGFDYWSEFPVVVRLALALVLGLAMVPNIAAGVDTGFSSVFKSGWARLVGLLVLGVAFVVFRSRGFAYGDGYTFPAHLGDGNLPVFDVHTSTQALDIVVHWALYRFILMPLQSTVSMSYAIWGAIGGIFSLWAIGRIASQLTHDQWARRLIIAAAVTSGAAVMWFGHLESYTLANAAMLWALFFALASQKKPRLIWAAWGVWILSVAFHQLAFALIPAIIWAHWRSRRPDAPAKNRSTVATILGAGFLAWALATVLQRQVGMPIFVPVYTTSDSLYSAFSLAHIIDALNLILFLAPISVVGLIAWLMGKGVGRTGGAGLGVVAVGAAATWYFTFWIDPLIGAFRDWDLLAAFGIPLSIWAGATIINRHRKGQLSRWLWVPVAAFGLVHTGAFVGTLQGEMAAALRIDRMVREDIHYTSGFFSGTRLPPWAAIIGRTLGRYDLSKDFLGLRVMIDPTDALAWANLGSAYKHLDMLDSATVCYAEAVARDSTNEKYANNLGVLYMLMGDHAGAQSAFERVVAMSDTAYASRATLAAIYTNNGQVDQAQQLLKEAIALRPELFGAYFLRAALKESAGDTLGALEDYELAVERGGRTDELFTRLIQLYQWSGKPVSAIDAARRWQRHDPNSLNAVFLEGTCHYMVGDYETAKAAFERAALINQEHALTIYYLASCYRNIGDADRARQFANRAAELDRTLALPYLELVYLAADAGDRPAAVAATSEYLKRAPADSGMPYLQQFMEP